MLPVFCWYKTIGNGHADEGRVQMDHVMKDCLMVSRQHRLADVCRRLHTPKISNIVVCGSSGEVHGVIPL